MTPWWRRRRALVCREAVALVTDYLDGALGARERSLLEQHLAACPHCSTYLAQIRATLSALGTVDADELPEETRAGLLELYRSYRAG